jgi:lipopolysaccharide export system protein LptC
MSTWPSPPARTLRLPLLCCALMAACSLPAPKKGDLPAKLPPQVSLEGVTVRSWEQGALVATGVARRLTYDRTTADFEGVDVVVRFPSQGRQGALEDLELRAPVAAGNLTSRQATGSGGVQILSPSGLIGATERARFDGVGLVASGDAPVAISGPGYSVDAEGFNFFLATEELVFDGQVHSHLGQAGDP